MSNGITARPFPPALTKFAYAQTRHSRDFFLSQRGLPKADVGKTIMLRIPTCHFVN
jgi:hypothetical protein